MKPISMQKFVMQQNMRYANKEITIEALQLSILNYAVFLGQPLTLGMFVPFDADGNVLEEPIWQVEWEKGKVYSDNLCNKSKAYQEAKDRVLFDGFEIESLEVYLIWIYIKGFNSDKGDFRIQYTKKSKSFWYSFNEFKTIEDLVQYNLVLTESAKKQIGL